MKVLEYGGIKVEWVGHATFRISYNDLVVYIDPYIVDPNPPKGDVILVTHDHFDHCDADAIATFSSDSTKFVVAEACRRKGAAVVKPGDFVEIEGLGIEAVPAYNIGKPFHPREKNYLGYLVRFGRTTVYHAGDTDVIPEMEELKGRVDIALLPIGGKYTMDDREAVRAVELIEPKIVVPMHYNFLPGLEKDPNVFKDLVGERAEVVIMEPLGKPRR